MAVDLAEYQKTMGTDHRLPSPQSSLDKNEKRWRNCFVADHGGEALADLKPRMVLGYCSLRKNKFQRATISGEDDNADERGYIRRR